MAVWPGDGKGRRGIRVPLGYELSPGTYAANPLRTSGGSPAPKLPSAFRLDRAGTPHQRPVFMGGSCPEDRNEIDFRSHSQIIFCDRAHPQAFPPPEGPSFSRVDQRRFICRAPGRNSRTSSTKTVFNKLEAESDCSSRRRQRTASFALSVICPACTLFWKSVSSISAVKGRSPPSVNRHLYPSRKWTETILNQASR